MEKNGMNVRNNTTKRLLPRMLDEYDVIVSMAEEPYIPDFLKDDKRVICWDVENPTFVDQKIAEDIYKKIEKLVEDLIEEI
jgi:protein-tyrosine-phosphatase